MFTSGVAVGAFGVIASRKARTGHVKKSLKSMLGGLLPNRTFWTRYGLCKEKPLAAGVSQMPATVTYSRMSQAVEPVLAGYKGTNDLRDLLKPNANGKIDSRVIIAIFDGQGKDELDAGYFYCPYIPLTMNGKPIK
jgi:hypothetical protein